MAQDDVIKRQTIIINYLRTGGKSFEDIQNHLEIESEIQSADLRISQRTFQRDITAIRRIYGIDIVFNRTKKVYEIDFEDTNPNTDRLMDSFALFNALNVGKQMEKFIQFEDKKTQGVHFILDIITAIKNSNIIELYHKKYDEDNSKTYLLMPLMIKEYRYRWYLVAKEKNSDKIKTFGLDRILKLDILNEKYEYPKDFDAQNYFNDFYGVITLDNVKTENIVLSFTSFQGKYIKSLPMHHSQKILSDNDKELRISLKLKPTIDFIMDLQYFGECVKVIKPLWLAEKIKNNFKKAVDNYK